LAAEHAVVYVTRRFALGVTAKSAMNRADRGRGSTNNRHPVLGTFLAMTDPDASRLFRFGAATTCEFDPVVRQQTGRS